MKKLILILICTTLISCNPFISKELRMKNKCNRKYEKLIKKCPQLLDTVFVDVPFEVIVPKVVIKDSISVRIDTLELLKYITKEQIRYIVKSISIDTLYADSLYRLQITLSNGVLSFDVEIAERILNEVVSVPVQVAKPVSYTIVERVQMWMQKSYWFLILIILAIISFFYAKSYFK